MSTPPEVLGLREALAALPERRALCLNCAEKVNFSMQTGQGVNIPEKYTCEGCGMDVLFVIQTPCTAERLLLLEARLVAENDANDQRKS